MSYSLYVYSKTDSAVDRGSIEEKMRYHGWEIRFAEDYGRAAIPPNGPVGDEWIVGWRSNPDVSSTVDRMLADGDRGGLDALYADMTLAGCEVWLTCPFDAAAELGEFTAEELSERFGDRIASVQQAKSSYHLRTAAGGSPFTCYFQEVLWHAIGELTGGLMEDPQSGELGSTHELPVPSAPVISDVPIGGEAPWFVIGWYTLAALVGAFLLIARSNPLQAGNWYVGLLLLHAPMAYGLYRGHRWAWSIAVGFTSVMIAVGLVSLVSGLSTPKLGMLGIYAAIIIQLLNWKVRLYFSTG